MLYANYGLWGRHPPLVFTARSDATVNALCIRNVKWNNNTGSQSETA